MSAHTICVDDVTSALRNDALEMERRNVRGERANGDAERLRATADYIDALPAQNAKLVAENAHLHKSLDVAADCALAKDLRLVTLQKQNARLVAALEKAEAIVAANATNRLHASRNGADPELEALLVMRAALKQAQP